jgi:hypothetical protein
MNANSVKPARLGMMLLQSILWDVYVYVKYLGDNIYLPLASMPHPAMSTYLDVTSCPSRFSYSVFSFIRPQGSTQGTVKNIDALLSGNDFRSHFGDRHNLWRLYLAHIY